MILYKTTTRYWLFLGLTLLTLMSKTEPVLAQFSNEDVNLALRRTADGLLRLNGDSISKIPTVSQIDEHIWQVRLEQDFNYEKLPELLQSSLDLYEIKSTYQVVIRNCIDSSVTLGYHQFDFVLQKTIPCQGRERSDTCRYIEVIFLDSKVEKVSYLQEVIVFFILLGGMVGFWYLGRKKHKKSLAGNGDMSQRIDFGASSLDVTGQKLYCKEEATSLTFRETKLLHLFVSHANRLLERDFIMQEVWADEGILVGRSLDVFVSRLRKKLVYDQSLTLVAVHGVGYRLEVA